MVSSMTKIGPLEYVVIGLPTDQFSQQILPELVSIQQSDTVRVVDLLFIERDADGRVTAREVHELGDDDRAPYADVADGLQGLLTQEDIDTLASELPAAESAVIVLLEHRWTQGLSEAVGKSGGKVLAGGMVSPDALSRLNQEQTPTATAH